MMGTRTSTTAPTQYTKLDASLRYEKLDNDLTPSDVPDFQADHTDSNGWMDASACVREMRDWLNERINAGEPQSPHTNDNYQTINFRSNIQHWEYRKSPVLTYPRTMDSHGTSCVCVSLKGTVDPDTRYDDPQPKNATYQHLWNIVTMFAHATGAEIRLQCSQKPRDDLKAYLFYDL